MSTERNLARVVRLPPPARGQFGPAHRVVEVITPQQWNDADPFILLMDDRLDGNLIGGPLPHAGFETVSFLVESQLADLAVKGSYRPVVEHRFPFERVADAYRVVDFGHKRGNVVVTLDPRAGER